MFGASDGRSYNGIQRLSALPVGGFWGYWVLCAPTG